MSTPENGDPRVRGGTDMIEHVLEKMDERDLRALCERWHIVELALFGSRVAGTPREESDIDVLVTYRPGHRPTFEQWLDLRDELCGLLGGEVDLVEKDRLVNPFRREEILRTCLVVYAA